MKKIFLNILIFFPITFVVFSVLLVCSLKSGPVEFTPLMLKREIQFMGEGVHTKQKWTPLKDMSPNVVKTIVMSEDDRFLQHRGVDLVELEYMYNEYKCKNGELRGCSTITQQVAKNCFTFSTDTFLRKILELYWASLLELLWGKERILEVYLNIIEVGKGLYGVETAAQVYFNCTAATMTLHDSAELAACLPSPLSLTPRNIWITQSLKVEQLIFRLKKEDYSVEML